MAQRAQRAILEPGWQQATVALHAALSSKAWSSVVAVAQRRAAVFDRVRTLHGSGVAWRSALARVAPRVPWPTFMHWRRKVASGNGELWERLLDRKCQMSPP